jgi:hypothetical protein
MAEDDKKTKQKRPQRAAQRNGHSGFEWPFAGLKLAENR